MITISVPTFVPRTYEKIGIEEALIQYKLGRRIIPSADIVKKLIQTFLNAALKKTIEETIIWINTFVPKRSGDLRQSLIKYLERSIPPPAASGELRGIRLVLGAGAEIFYAAYVNEFTTKQVAHKGTFREHYVDYTTKKGVEHHPRAYSKGRRIWLYDPKAVGGYHDKMIAYAAMRFKINVAKNLCKVNTGS